MSETNDQRIYDRCIIRVGQLEAENASLMGAAQGLGDLCDQLKAENAKLRELVRELYEDQCCDGEQWKYRDRMHELGIEVDA